MPPSPSSTASAAAVVPPGLVTRCAAPLPFLGCASRRHSRPAAVCVASCLASAGASPASSPASLETLDQQEHVCGPLPDTAVTASICRSSSVQAIGADSREQLASTGALLALVTALLRGQDRHPLPIAAGVFGIARTMAAFGPSTRSIPSIVLPAAIEQHYALIPALDERGAFGNTARADSA